MKVLFCTKCGDIRSFQSSIFTFCECGNMGARWTDPNKGTVTVKARDRNYVRIIGLNNRMLYADATLTGRHLDPEQWRALHDIATDAKGYIFDNEFRKCWACVMQVGQTGDVTWEPETPEEKAHREMLEGEKAASETEALKLVSKIRLEQQQREAEEAAKKP